MVNQNKILLTKIKRQAKKKKKKKKKRLSEWCRKDSRPVLFERKLDLPSDATPNYKYMSVSIWVHYRMSEKLITKTRLLKYTENFTTKNDNFSEKKILIFLIFLHKT